MRSERNGVASDKIIERVLIGTVACVLIAGCVTVAVVTRNWIAVGLVLASPVVTYVGVDLAQRSMPVGWVAVVGGVALLGAATWTAGMEGRWVWAIPWGFASAGFLISGAVLWNTEQKVARGFAAFALACGAFAVLGPWLLYPMMTGAGAVAGEAPKEAARVVAAGTAAGGWSAVASFGTDTITSVWGWLNLAVLAAVGRTLHRRWGIPAVLGGAGALVVATGFLAPQAAGALASAFSSSPAGAAAVWLHESQRVTGTAGWALIVAGFAAMLALAPTMRRLAAMTAHVAGGPLRSALTWGAAPSTEDVEDPVGLFLGVLLILGIGTSVPIAHWIALRGSGTLPFPAIGMPDLAVPQFRPVWHVSYFAVAAAVSATALLSSMIARRRSVAGAVVGPLATAWAGGWPFVLAMIAPGGVMVLSAAIGLGSLVVLALPVSRKAASVVSSDLDTAGVANLMTLLASSSGSNSVIEPQPSFEPPPLAEEPSPPIGEPAPSGRRVVEVPIALVDAVETADGAIVTLEPRGEISWWRAVGGRIAHTVRVVGPLGLVPATGSDVVLVDGGGRMQQLRAGSDGLEVVHSIATGGPFDLYAAPPGGSFVAYADSSRPVIHRFDVAEETIREVATLPGMPRVLAVSTDGRRIALALAEGAVFVLDAEAGTVVLKIEPHVAERPTPVHMSARPQDGWVLAYADRSVIAYDANATAVSVWELADQATCLAVCPGTGRVAIGGSRGSVQVRSADLATVLFEGELLGGPVTRMWFSGSEVFAVTTAGAVRAVTIPAS